MGHTIDQLILELNGSFEELKAIYLSNQDVCECVLQSLDNIVTHHIYHLYHFYKNNVLVFYS